MARADAFADQPTLTTVDAVAATGTSRTQTNAALARLEAAGIVREITGRKRDRVFEAPEIAAEFLRLERRIERAF